MFTNYQTFPHGGDGWLRIFAFHPATNKISVQTFSPSSNSFKTDPANQFTLNYHDPHVATGGGTLSGMVRDSSTCAPIASVTVKSGSASAVTDITGHYSLSLPAGSHAASTDAVGWAPGAGSETVFNGFDSDLNFVLIPAAQAIHMTAAPATATLRPGASAVFSLKISSDAPLAATVSFSCAGLPLGASCTFAPASVTPDRLPAGVQLKVSTKVVEAAGASHLRNAEILPACCMFVALVVMSIGQQKRRTKHLLVMLCLLACLAGFAACAGIVRLTGTPKGVFPVQVISTSGALQGSAQISLTVQ